MQTEEIIEAVRGLDNKARKEELIWVLENCRGKSDLGWRKKVLERFEEITKNQNTNS